IGRILNACGEALRRGVRRTATNGVKPADLRGVRWSWGLPGAFLHADRRQGKVPHQAVVGVVEVGDGFFARRTLGEMAFDFRAGLLVEIADEVASQDGLLRARGAHDLSPSLSGLVAVAATRTSPRQVRL